MQIVIDGIPIEVTKKKMKSLRLRVLPPDGRVLLSAPKTVPERAIRNFIISHIGWIREKQEMVKSEHNLSAQSYVDGETFYLWGQKYYLQIKNGAKKSLALCGDKAILTVRSDSTEETIKKFVNEWYRDRLKEEISRLLPKWETATGLRCSSWQTKNMTTRWGTCNTKTKKIWLNLQLAKKPTVCLEYVILHELAHTRVPNHGEDFKAILNRFMPSWKEVKKLLNDFPLDSYGSRGVFDSVEL